VKKIEKKMDDVLALRLEDHEAYSADICDEKLFRSDINMSRIKMNIS
jgi:hypothetical protein